MSIALPVSYIQLGAPYSGKNAIKKQGKILEVSGLSLLSHHTTPQMLNTMLKPLVRENLMTTDFGTLSSYLYGDEIMSMHSSKAVGMPYCSGYACGYVLIRHYLQKTGKTIFEATVTPTAKLLQATEDFWL